MKKNNLTTEEIYLMSVIKNKWLDRFNSLEFDEKKTEEFIEYCYGLSGLDKPTIIKVNSPMACQIAANLFKSQNKDQVEDQVWNQVWDQVRNQVEDQVEDQVRNQVEDQVRNQVRNQVWNQVEDQVWNQVEDQVRNQVRNQVRDQVENIELKYFTFCWRNFGDFNWVSFYDYFTQIKIINNDKFNKYLKLLYESSCHFYLAFKELVIVSRPPVFISRDDKNELHCESDYAIAYNDGYGQHYLHGVYIEPKLFEKIKNNTITSEEILELGNVELKAVIIQTLGYEKIFDGLKNKALIQEHTEHFNNENNKPVKYQLFDTKLNNISIRLLKVGWYEKDRFRETVLGVPGNIDDIMEARAWTFGMSKEEYFNGKLKFRQGDVLVVYKNKTGGMKNES